MNEPTTSAGTLRSTASRPTVRIGAIAALALLAGLAVWLILRATSDSSEKAQQATAAVLSEPGLKTLAASLGRPVYWAGPESGKRFEVTQTRDGSVYVCYLPASEKRCFGKPFLTIGTYPRQDALAATQSAAKEPGAVSLPMSGGGAAFYSKQRPESIYFAVPGSDYQVEIYDPDPAKARRLFASGRVEAVPRVLVLSETGLRTLVRGLGRPVYWAGAESGKRYELTQTMDGRVYVCYPATDAKACSVTPSLTVATYPVASAVAVTRAAALKPGSVPVKVGGGGVGFYARSRPTSVYVAFPGRPFQIEVYDPDAARALELVSSGKIVTLR